MKPRRLLGAILCVLLISAGATAAHAAFSNLNCGVTIYLPPSFFSLDIFDDFADTGYPDGVVNRSAREKVPLKLSLLFKLKVAKVTSPALLTPQTLPQAFSSQQELYRYQEVFRI
jgi:hypothetical protein